MSRYEATTRGAVTASQNAGQVIVNVFRNAADSGTRTMNAEVEQREAEREIEARAGRCDA